MPIALPRTCEELTAAWLTGALSPRFPGIRVLSLQIKSIIWGTATKVLVEAEYDDEHAGNSPPQQLCIKGDFDERVRQTFSTMAMTGTEVEASFYNDVAPKLGIPLLNHWYAGSEPGMGILVFENLTDGRMIFGSPTTPWSSKRVAQGLEVLAALHGSTWDRRFPEISWLRVGSKAVQAACEHLLSEAHWNGQFSRPDAFKLPAGLSNRARNINAMRKMWQYNNENAHCVIHGDAHLGNTCVNASGKPFFIDWAGPCYSHWAFDVATFMAGALTIDDRRADEAGLLHHYLNRLSSSGGPQLDEQIAWMDYRRNILNGITWPTLPPALQAPENVFALGERYTAALLDHDTLGLLEN